MDSHGRFIWYELMTTDMAAAKAFYAKVVGWGTQDVSTPNMDYGLFIAGRASVSGIMTLPEDARDMGAIASWIGYVGVDDVDAAARRVRELGGAVLVPPTDIPGISRFSVFADPQRAALALVKWLRPRKEEPAELSSPRRVGWHELLAADCEKAMAFYGELFGWQEAGSVAGAKGTYQLFSAAGQTVGDIVTKPAELAFPFWLYYFNVGNIDAAAKRVKAAGGEVFEGPLERPDGSWSVACTDPQGAMFALVAKRSGTIGYFERANRDDP